MNSLIDKLYKYKLNYIGFLVLAYLLLNLIYLTTFITAEMNLVLLAILSPGVYLSVYFLIPRFLYTKQYFTYLILVALIIGLTGWPVGEAMGYFYSKGEKIKLNEEQSLYFFRSGSFGVMFMVAFFTSTKLFMDRMRVERLRDKLQTEKLQTELRFLRAQINPHFIFNAYNNIYFLIKKDPELASETLLKLSDIMRYQLYDAAQDTVPLGKEVEIISNFVEIEKIRKGDKLRVSMDSAAINPHTPIAPLMLLTFVENAFKHISAFADRPNEVSIHISNEEDFLFFEVKNTRDKKPKPSTEPSGIGLTNVKRQLELLYKNKHELLINELDNSFEIKLKLQTT